MNIISENTAFGGMQGVFSHESEACGCEMTFAVFLPPQAIERPCPVLWYLSGLTCTHANVMEKGEYRRICAELGLIFVAPDTSPRGEGVPDDAEGAYDFGLGAGFYVGVNRSSLSLPSHPHSFLLENVKKISKSSYPKLLLSVI